MLKTSLIFYLVLIGTFSFAQDWSKLKDENTFRTKMQSNVSKLKSLKADFTQVKHLSFMEQDVLSKGNFAYQVSDKLLWEYKTPVKYKIVMNGENVLIKDETGTKQYNTKENPAFAEISKMMSSGLSGGMLSDVNFKHEIFYNGSKYKIKLLPLNEELKKYLTGIELLIDGETYVVSKIKMLELGGDYTEISLFNLTQNSQLGEEVFSLH